MTVRGTAGTRGLITAAVILLSLSCSSRNSKPKDPGGPVVWISDNVTITFPLNVSAEKQALLLEAARIHTWQFELDWGAKVAPLQVFILKEDVKVFDCGGNPAIGCHWAPNGPVQITMGLSFETPALYHEYIHQMITGNDHDHADPRWVSFWEPRRFVINQQIIASRKP